MSALLDDTNLKPLDNNFLGNVYDDVILAGISTNTLDQNFLGNPYVPLNLAPSGTTTPQPMVFMFLGY